MEWHQVLIRPLITEKGTDALARKDSRHICYPFEVHQHATKTEIKEALVAMAMALFDKKVEVKRVNTITVRGKTRRRGLRTGMTRSWKKAFIYLPADQAIEIV
jgi:large subunit ribosomal protein L23